MAENIAFGFHSVDMLPNLISHSMTFPLSKRLKTGKLLPSPVLSEAMYPHYEANTLAPFSF